MVDEHAIGASQIEAWATGLWMGNGVYEVSSKTYPGRLYCSVDELKHRKYVKRIDQNGRAEAYLNTPNGQKWLWQEHKQYQLLRALYNVTEPASCPVVKGDWIQIVRADPESEFYRKGYIFKVDNVNESSIANSVEFTCHTENKNRAGKPFSVTHCILQSDCVVLRLIDAKTPCETIDQVLELDQNVHAFAEELAKNLGWLEGSKNHG